VLRGREGALLGQRDSTPSGIWVDGPELNISLGQVAIAHEYGYWDDARLRPPIPKSSLAPPVSRRACPDP
jgi:hypothetical protein